MENERTLTERVRRIEDILVYTGIAGDGNEPLRDEGDVRFDVAHGFVGEGETLRGAGALGGKDYREAQHARNLRGSIAVRPFAFDQIMERIHAATDRVRQTAGRLEDIGTRVMGPLPEGDGGKNGIEAAPDGSLDHTYRTLDWLDNALARLEAAALRLERI